MKGNLTPVFTDAAMFNKIDNFEKNKIEKIYQTLCFIGENFSNDSRSVQSYRDRTANLRGSIGYIVGFNGVVKKRNIKGKKVGRSRATELSNQILKENKQGFVLIGFAGMEYAAAVESKGYDVITAMNKIGQAKSFEWTMISSSLGGSILFLFLL